MMTRRNNVAMRELNDNIDHKKMVITLINDNIYDLDLYKYTISINSGSVHFCNKPWHCNGTFKSF